MENIALIVKTRSAVQVRTHAQKYFQRLEKEMREEKNYFTPTDTDNFYSFRLQGQNTPYNYLQPPMVQMHSQPFRYTNSQSGLKQEYFPSNDVAGQIFNSQKLLAIPASCHQVRLLQTFVLLSRIKCSPKCELYFLRLYFRAKNMFKLNENIMKLM